MKDKSGRVWYGAMNIAPAFFLEKSSFSVKIRYMRSKLPQNFKPLFWSHRFSLIDPVKHKKTIITNTINYGRWEHWQWIIKNYGKREVKKIIEESPASEFRPRALKLISLLLGIKKLKYASRSAKIRAEKNSQKA